MNRIKACGGLGGGLGVSVSSIVQSISNQKSKGWEPWSYYPFHWSYSLTRALFGLDRRNVGLIISFTNILEKADQPANRVYGPTQCWLQAQTSMPFHWLRACMRTRTPIRRDYYVVPPHNIT